MLRFTIEPLGPDASPVARRDEATREMRRLVAPLFGRDALRWFDARSEEWRGFGGMGWMNFGAWFGSAFDEDGLYAAKIYYELLPDADRRAVAGSGQAHPPGDGRDADPDADLHLDRLQARQRQPARDLPASRAADDQRARAADEPARHRPSVAEPDADRRRRARRTIRAAAGRGADGRARDARTASSSSSRSCWQPSPTCRRASST